MNPNIIVDTIKRYFGIQLNSMDRSLYRITYSDFATLFRERCQINDGEHWSIYCTIQ